MAEKGTPAFPLDEGYVPEGEYSPPLPYHIPEGGYDGEPRKKRKAREDEYGAEAGYGAPLPTYACEGGNTSVEPKRKRKKEEEESNKARKKFEYVIEVKADISGYVGEDTVVCLVANCVALKPFRASVIEKISSNFSYVNPYRERVRGAYANLAHPSSRPMLGSVQMRSPPYGCDETGPTFACLFSQYRMGGTSSEYYLRAKNIDEDYIYKSLERDDDEHRLENFRLSLNLLKDVLEKRIWDHVKTVVFPKFIGTGGACEMWDGFREHIASFAEELRKSRKIKVVIADGGMIYD